MYLFNKWFYPYIYFKCFTEAVTVLITQTHIASLQSVTGV